MDHDHLPALAFLLFGAPCAVLALAAVQHVSIRRWPGAANRLSTSSVTARLASLLMLLSGLAHLGLVETHLDRPLLAAAFLLAGLGLTGMSFIALMIRRWRQPAAIVVGGVLAAYWSSRLLGLEGIYAVGVAVALIEMLALLVIALDTRAGAPLLAPPGS